MVTILRYAGIVLGVLVLALVFMACGEGACGACVHACCVRIDRTDRLRTVLSRVLAACSACCDKHIPLLRSSASIASSPGTFMWPPTLVGGMSPLRI